MTLPNPPQVSQPIPNQPFYSPETPATFDLLSGVLTPNIQLVPNPTAADPEPWQRPGYWLALPSIKSTEEKFAGLFPIYNVDANFVAFTFEGDYIVDWGDGHTEYVESGVKAQHAYDWNRIPATTLTPEGFRQVVVVVTPQSNSGLTYMNLAKRHDNQILGLVAPPIDIPWLDIAVSMPNAGVERSIRVSDDYAALYSQLQQFSMFNTGNCQYMDYLLASSYNLRSFVLENAHNVEDLSDALEYCYSLQQVNLSGLTSVYGLVSMFYSCYLLKTVELHDLTSATDFSGIFDYCYSLQSVRFTGLNSADSNSITDLAQSYNGLETPESLSLEDLTSLASPFSFYHTNLKGKLKLTGLTGLSSINSSFTDLSLKQIHLSGLDNVTDAADAFDYSYSLEEVILEGTQNIETWDYCFYDCTSLVNAPVLDTSSATSMYYMFVSCLSLQNVPEYDTSNVEDMGHMFDECSSLQKVPYLDAGSCESLSYMFTDCTSITRVPLINTSSVTDMSGCFYNCYSLKEIPKFDVSAVTSFDSAFEFACQLASVSLQGMASNISFSGCCLSRNAIVDIFNGLANADAEIDVQYNYGAADLTAEDIAIATGKGWTVLY